jgi:hypothetical protein
MAIIQVPDCTGANGQICFKKDASEPIKDTLWIGRKNPDETMAVRRVCMYTFGVIQGYVTFYDVNGKVLAQQSVSSMFLTVSYIYFFILVYLIISSSDV